MYGADVTGVMRNMEICWDDLVDAFENRSAETSYFLDRQTGEVFFVPAGYEDQDFWDEVDRSAERYLQIPPMDYEEERFLIYTFIKSLQDRELKDILRRTFSGRGLFGKLEEILSFFPSDWERFVQLREELVTGRIRFWLEENNIFPMEKGD